MKNTIDDGLVSIIIPVYNKAEFLDDTIQSVLNQTYKNWELLLVNDASTDKSLDIIVNYSDLRIKLIDLEKNVGVALARNHGIDVAKGRYITYLDADDFWTPEKLEKQIQFIKQTNCAFSYTGYEFANENGIPNGKKVKVPVTLTYKQALKNTIIWTTTVMFDLKKINKDLLYMPNIKSEDTASWWKILKNGYIAYGLNEVLAYYRRSENTLSSNKLVAIKRIWNLYRNFEKLNLVKSIYNFCFYAVNTVKKRI